MNRADFAEIRNWSDIECARAMALLMDRMDEAVDLLTALGADKDEKAAEYAKHKAHWMLYAKVERQDLKSDPMREAWVMDQVEGTYELYLAAELAESLYKDQTMRIRAMFVQADLLRSMMRSARDNTEGWPENRAAAQENERNRY